MSADPERVFSSAQRTISWERMSLRADTINIGECLKSWIRSGITEGLLVDVIKEFVKGSVSRCVSEQEGTAISN
jgi:hypothetical protein